MDVNDTQKLASRIKEDVEVLRSVMRNELENGKSMFYNDTYAFLAEVMRDTGVMLATAESDWWEMRSKVIKRKVAIKQLQKNEIKS